MPEIMTMMGLALVVLAAIMVLKKSSKRKWGENHESWWKKYV